MIFKDPMLWRIFWKEYRAQRSFWLAIAGFGIGLMVLLMMLLDASSGRFGVPWVIALGLPSLYTLGCGAVLFASEQEEGTTEFLRILATRTSRLFAAKVVFGFISTAALSGLLLGAARILTWGQPLNFASGNGATALYSAWVTISLLAWGILFSTVCRKVLTAVCLAAVAPVFIRFSHQWFPWSGHGEAQSVWYLELALSIPVLCASYVLLQRTMTGRDQELRWPRLSWRRAAADTLDRLAEARDTAPAWRRLFLRLVWLEVRHALSLGHVLWVGGIALFLLAISLPTGRLHMEQTILGAFIFPTLIGVWTFHAEGGRRTRFLAEVGLSPVTVWLSKQLVWLLLTIVVTAPFLIAVEIFNHQTVQREIARSSMFHGDLPDASASAFVIALACLGYSMGQLASMLIPRGVTAGFVAFAVYALLVPWTWLMTAVQVPLWISVAPLVVFMLTATLVWSRHWLLESAAWRSWRRLGLAAGATLLLVWAGVGTFRVLEVPSLEEFVQARTSIEPNPFQQASVLPITAAEAETAEMYRRAHSEYTWREGRPWESDGLGKTARDGWEFARDEERKLLAENQKALETTLAATARPWCAFKDPSQPQAEWISHQGVNDYPELVNLILLSARQLETEGKLDDALERYLATLRLARHVASRGPTWQWQRGASLERVIADWMPLWATLPGQSPERIEAGARRVREELSRFPALSEAVQIERLWIRHVIDRDWSEILAEPNKDLPASVRVAVSLFDRLCPWERYRARRLLDLVSFAELGYSAAVEQSLAIPGVDPSGIVKSTVSPRSAIGLAPRASPALTFSDEIPEKWASTTFPWNIWHFRDESFIVQTRLARELPLRALLLRLAVAAWKNAHGEFPARLDDLSDARGVVTTDPYTGSEFGYRPAGFPSSVRFINPTTYHEEIVPPGEPVLWSAGPFKVRIVPIHRSLDQPPEFGTVDSNGPIDERRAKHIGAYVFRLP